MNHIWLKLLAGSALALSTLTAVPAVAQTSGSDPVTANTDDGDGREGASEFLDFDDDKDTVLTQDEFIAGFSGRGTYGTWDANGDGMLSQDEFDRGVFLSFDANRDGRLDQTEMGGRPMYY